jgi:hypothetical protein
MDAPVDAVARFGPWRPGIESTIPEAIRPLSTFLRPEATTTPADTARELCDYTGLPRIDVVAFRPERLALHELLIRVTADLSVPDGTRIEDLGINFREITRTILARYVEPRMGEVVATYERVRREAAAIVAREMAMLFGAAPAARHARGGWWQRLLHRGAPVPGVSSMPEPEDGAPNREARIAALWDRRAHTADDPVEAATFRALARVLSAVLVRHGRVWGSREMLAALATDIACNACASDAIGRLLEPWLAEAVRREGYRPLAPQPHPVVMNTKGASASGKSTLRPLQRRLAFELGVDWRGFALISPDIWRKQLLDYGSLGEHYKYAGAFTGEELRVVDQKLDRYMARKAARGEMPHLLIDRFRFDSFAPDSDEAGSNLLTRFGEILYLFFMITPPALLVERAWHRGLEVGRYKAVDDTLAHGIEAYSGMPEFFFTWIDRRDKRVHFEFLDNGVRLPQQPRTVAFGDNDAMSVLDVGGLLAVERFRRVNVDARDPGSLYLDADALAPTRNTGFLRQCIAHFHEVNFARQDSGRVYLRVVDGAPAWVDREATAAALEDADTRAGIEAIAHDLDAVPASPAPPLFLRDLARAEPIATLGAWGDRSAPAASGSEPWGGGGGGRRGGLVWQRGVARCGALGGGGVPGVRPEG